VPGRARRRWRPPHRLEGHSLRRVMPCVRAVCLRMSERLLFSVTC
jgi:hypothetical protein